MGLEEGEISDTASVEEISEEVFNNNQEVVVLKESKPKGESARVWTMRDLYNKYPTICRGYASAGLYNLAWAQAVQNKPLNDIFVMDVEQDEVSKRSSPSSSVASVNSKEVVKKEVDKVVIDDSGDEKEEGELEEGEIDLDLESVEKVIEEKDLVNGDGLDKKVESIRGDLESVVNVIDADKSFQGVCSKLQNALESLREVIFDNNVLPRRDALIQLAFSAVQAINSVFCSLNNDLKEQNKDIFSRLLSLVKSHYPPLFLPEQMKEIEAVVSSLDSRNIFLGAIASNKEKEMMDIDGLNKTDCNALAESAGHDLTLKHKLLPVESSIYNKHNMLLEASKPGLPGLKSRVLLPLLDLHKDHDADSLPSPTRETTPSLPARTALTVGDGMVKSGLTTAKAAHDSEDIKMRYYETDVLKAVSSYQQKFSNSSFFSNDRLPSPTPSEESGEGDGDTGGEISSSSTIDKSKVVNPPVSVQEAVSSSQRMDNSSIQGFFNARNTASVSSGSNPIVKASVRSRDPRLRFANPDALDLNQRPVPMVHNAPKAEPVGGIMSSRKQKTMEEASFGGPATKRQRHRTENYGVGREAKTVHGSSGWSEDTNMFGPKIPNRNQFVESAVSDPKKLENGTTCPSVTVGTQNVVASRNEPVPVTVPSTTASLPALLKDIAVNPIVLLNILKMGQQQRLTVEAQQKSNDPLRSMMHPPSLSPIVRSVPLENVALSTPSVVLPKPTGTVQVPSPAASLDEVGKVRMKPRDPRRVLHGNSLQRSGSLGPELLKTDGPSTSNTQGGKDSLNSQKQQGQAETKQVQSQSVPPPDITRQFTKNLKNLADIMSVSQASTNQPMVSQNLPCQPSQIELERTDVTTVAPNHDDKRSGAGAATDGPVGSSPQSSPTGLPVQNTWGDVAHLFEGYDELQKAAIQRERTRRIEEQKKMFAARKLCLVLDLDHTLLNSAKFNEVDPVHDEILRKKEEEDREKPQRHLFRFPHMSMWTKLRPGIWKFLERASKLYELHLYTMGNKLYATEMAKVLDPKGVLFNGRVISRGDDGDPFDSDNGGPPKSKDLEGVLGLESGVVIVDDSVRVWPHHKMNLIVVERYIYFPCSRRQFGLPGPSLLEIDVDERAEDGTLASSLMVIERIHQDFFSHQSLDDADVRSILVMEQKRILAGCRIVFSRVIPIGEANPHLHPLWQTAEQFGAVCTNQIDEQVTHVVANSLGTDKVNWALSTGRFVVYPSWVEASALLYRRANEQDFAVKT
ncbi:hypothetical protein Pint_23807 [Pistacia integerrima]|uniref:Uncharacterized protein n=1 Tax=Pistacia integerrima TaxID=434235 RepID=A0ACC0YJR0_9ROSI|nr:hypothetical protein Pint_23807 [Pistacia integerrima]